MIQANEIRKGNKLQSSGEEFWPFTVETIQNDGINEKFVHDEDYLESDPSRDIVLYEHLAGIPLTEEILLKCGLHPKVNYIKGLQICDGKAFFSDNEFGHKQEDEIECKYLHQLQNLYFALTGEELNVEL